MSKLGLTLKSVIVVRGEWIKSAENEQIIDPLNGDVFLNMPATKLSEIDPFVESLIDCPKHGLHNPLKNVER
jgi:1-pyrroline-5-carboxylate dehydrogenase